MTFLFKTALAVAAPGLIAAAAPAALAAPAFDTTPVASSYAGVGESWEHGRHGRNRWDRDDYGRRGYYNNNGGGYRGATWRGRDGRYYCRRDNGTTGLLIGGAVGGLIGNEVAGRGDRTLGTVLGVAGGALLGREIDRGGSRCR